MADESAAHDALEQVRWQQSEAGQRQHASVARHWRRLLSKVATERFGDPVDEQSHDTGASPATRPRPTWPMRAIAERLGQPDTSPILMAAVAMALAQVTGMDPNGIASNSEQQIPHRSGHHGEPGGTERPVRDQRSGRTFDGVVNEHGAA